MKLTKIKKILTISLPIICGFSTAFPLVLSTTSCSKQSEWTFTNSKEINAYLLKHKVSLSNKHEFAPLYDYYDPELKNQITEEEKRIFYEDDYHFITDNLNPQLIVNSFIFEHAKFYDWDSNSVNLKKVNNTYTISTSNVEEGLKSTTQIIITYNNKIIKIQNKTDNIIMQENVFDFNEAFLYQYVQSKTPNVGTDHYVKCVFDSANTNLVYLSFRDSNSGKQHLPDLRFSPFDWSNDKISWVPSYDNGGK